MEKKSFRQLMVVTLLILLSLQLFAQTLKVSGIVKDEKGKPLSGVSVSVKDAGRGTSTNAAGEYSLPVPEKGTLVFSHIGYAPAEIQIGSGASYDITLKPGSATMGEVIVVAYGSTSKRASTGAIQTIGTKDLEDLPVTQLTQKLQGKMAGVQINQSTGKPGQGMQVRIRGQVSILAGSDPLYVVDGFPIVGDISTINPDEIESISVLKDAASTSLYGSRAANGVVVITTKHSKGAAGQTSVGVNAYYGVQEVPQKGRPQMMNGQEFAEFKNEYYSDLGQPVPAPFQNPSQYANNSHDWYAGMLQHAPVQNYSISVNSNSNRVSTSIVAGFLKQEGVLRNSDFTRFSLRVNSEFKITDDLKAGFNLAPLYSQNSIPASDGAFYATNISSATPGGLLYNSLLTWPILPYKNADGSLPLTAYIPGISAFPTPNWYRALNEITNVTKTSRLLSNAYLEYQPIKGLTLKSSINIDNGSSPFVNFQPSTASTTFASLPPGVATSMRKNDFYYSWLNENLATYKRSFGEHNFELLGGFTTQKYHDQNDQLSLNNFPDDRIRTIQSAINIDRTQSFSDVEEWSLISYISRLNYNYKSRYFLSAAIRRDGSSRFGSGNRWGNFPSVSAAWIASDEKFLQSVKNLSLLKFRSSYGTIGNNNIGNYTQYATVNTTTNAIFGVNVAPGASVTALGNNNLGWETTKQFDFGLDLALFNNRLLFTYDYYNKKTTNLLYNLATAQESGFSSFNGNIGALKFWGNEFMVSGKILTGEFKWNVDLNIAFSDNKVLALSNGVNRIYGGQNGYATLTQVGHRVGQFWGLEQEGVYKDQADFNKSPKATASEVGTIKFKDVNNDGVITYGGDNDDRTYIGNPFPKFIYGVSSNFSYRHFDLSVIGSGSQGNDLLVMTEQGTTNLDGVFNVLKNVKDRWRSPTNPGAGLYGKTTSGTANERDWEHSRFVSNASFFTIKNITLGYAIPVKNNKFIRSLRMFGSVQQAFVFTKYRGANPEANSSQDGTTPTSALNLGFDWGTYPVPRTYSFGFNIGFNQ